MKDQGHEAALHMHDNTDKAAQMLLDAARQVCIFADCLGVELSLQEDNC